MFTRLAQTHDLFYTKVIFMLNLIGSCVRELGYFACSLITGLNDCAVTLNIEVLY